MFLREEAIGTPAPRVSASNFGMMALTVQHILVGAVLALVPKTREQPGWSVCGRVWYKGL